MLGTASAALGQALLRPRDAMWKRNPRVSQLGPTVPAVRRFLRDAPLIPFTTFLISCLWVVVHPFLRDLHQCWGLHSLVLSSLWQFGGQSTTRLSFQPLSLSHLQALCPSALPKSRSFGSLSPASPLPRSPCHRAAGWVCASRWDHPSHFPHAHSGSSSSEGEKQDSRGVPERERPSWGRLQHC